MFCKVAFAVPLRKLFDYSVPPNLAHAVKPGLRVRAPFGKAVATGVVVEVMAIMSVEDTAPLFGTEAVGLAQYIAQRWCTPVGEVLGAMLPSWLKPLTLEELHAEVAKDLKKLSGVVEPKKTASAAEKKAAPKPAKKPEPVKEPAPENDWAGTLFENAGNIEVSATHFSGTSEEAAGTLPQEPEFHCAEHESELDMDAMGAAFYDAPLGGTAAMPAPEPEQLDYATAAVARTEVVPERLKLDITAFTLTADQRAAYDALVPLVRAKKHQSTLLCGDSLTGKTEVFIRLMETVLNCGRQALYLLPDIALTQPFMEEFSARFGAERTVLWHSRLTPRQKNIIFNRLVSGESLVIAGTRSACLLPFANLGLAVMDEEHDDSYKQEEQKPYYHAREVLVWRAAHHGCPVLFASSAPSMETLRFALDGRIAMHALNQPVRRVSAPKVIITGKKGAASKYVSDELRESIESALARKQQALLIINRLGFASAYACLCCGWTMPCPKCGGGMAKYKSDEGGDFLKCWFCGTTAELPTVCPKCRDRIFKTVGSGTQRAILEVQKLFPQARIVRVDSDTLKGKNSEGLAALERLAAEEADIVIGTKLITRGYRFPKLSVAALLDADTELAFPDFRSSERTCQMLFQTRGRLFYGTGEPVFIIQTFKLDEAVFKSVANGDYMVFAKEELQLRSDLGYPPYGRIVRVTVRAPNRAGAQKVCGEVSAAVAGINADGKYAEGKDFELMGPTPCYVPKTLKSSYYQFMLKSADAGYTTAFMDTVARIPVRRPAMLKIIADPSDFR